MGNIHYSAATQAAVKQYFEAGFSDEDIFAITKVSERTLRRWRSHIKRFGQIKSPIPRGGRRKLTRYEEDALFLYLLETPDAYQDEMRWFIFDEFGKIVSDRALRRLFRNRGWSKKVMTQRALQQSMPLRADWIARIREYTKDQFVFVDESACNSRTADRKYGWSPIGEPALGVQVLKREKRWSLLPAYTINGYLPGYLIVQGSINGHMFYSWLENNVLPYCQPYPLPRSVIVMDNASGHINQRIRQLIESAGCRVEYLPPYSPDFNPIERSFHELKAYIKRHRREISWFDNFGSFLGSCVERRVLFKGAAEGHFRRSMIV